MECLQLDFLTQSRSGEVIQRVRETGILPVATETAGFSEEERNELSAAWLEGMASARQKIDAYERRKFAARGWAFRWFLDWRPSTPAEETLSDAMEEAIDVVERTYGTIVERGLDRSEDMGLLMTSAFGGSEGVRVKREAYGRLVLVSVCAVTGPRNVCAAEGTVEFEPGSRSHLFHLVYRQLPSMERLVGDLAAYPIIKAESNRDPRAPGGGVWMSEGWINRRGSNFESRPRVHRPWDTIAEIDFASAALSQRICHAS